MVVTLGGCIKKDKRQFPWPIVTPVFVLIWQFVTDFKYFLENVMFKNQKIHPLSQVVTIFILYASLYFVCNFMYLVNNTFYRHNC